jgi:RNA polymerase sigma factor (sigma-70 family)
VVTSAAAARVAEVEPMVRAICRSRLGHHAGDDAAQQVLLRIWRHMDGGREFENLHSYAVVSARYECLPDSRPGRPQSVIAVGEVADLWADDVPGPCEQVVRAEQASTTTARVEELLSRLTPREAEAVRSTVLADRSTAEAAQTLGIKPTSVRSAQVRAMARLRELCSTQSPNPLAHNLTAVERGRRQWQREKARGTNVEQDRDGGDAVHDDPLELARSAVAGAEDAGWQLAQSALAAELPAAERADDHEHEDAECQR